MQARLTAINVTINAVHEAEGETKSAPQPQT
jgi:hypothetical protein